jgi:hypothetical protein
VSPAVLVLPASLTSSADVTASVAQPSPTPTGPTGEFQDFEVSPGLLGFIPPFLIALACVVLFLSLTRHLRRVTVRQAQIDAAEAAGSDQDRPEDPSEDRPGSSGGSGGSGRPGDDRRGGPR